MLSNYHCSVVVKNYKYISDKGERKSNQILFVWMKIHDIMNPGIYTGPSFTLL